MEIEEISKFVEISKCRKYTYPVDSVTKRRLFAPIAYFIKLVETKYGNSLERFVKEYQSRETKKYISAGYSIDQIKELAAKHNGKLPKIKVVKAVKDPRIPKAPRKKRLDAVAISSETITNAEGVEITRKTYPWSSNPTEYFKSPPIHVSIEELTKESCLRPANYLDNECRGCEFYAACQCTLKYTKWRN